MHRVQVHAWVCWLILVLFILLSNCPFSKVKDKVTTTLVSILYFLVYFIFLIFGSKLVVFMIIQPVFFRLTIPFWDLMYAVTVTFIVLGNL